MAKKPEVVIGGIAGRYPESDSLLEFKEALYSGKDFVSEDERRFKLGALGAPRRAGKINNLNKFDANFFNVSHKQANFTDPRQRILLEVAFEAVLDAGFHPDEIKGTNTAVFIACSAPDNSDILRKHPGTGGYANVGIAPTICANRVSYSLDIHGPSFAVDSACGSSLHALTLGWNAIQSGECDFAIVGGVQLNMHPQDTLELFRLNMVGPNGYCRVFDEKREGYVRSEGIVAVFLQKKETARRIYADLIGSRMNHDGYKEEGITYPSHVLQSQLIRQLYADVNIKGADIAYMEAHGTSTYAGDPQECKSLSDVLCEGRKGPLLIGSLKSNMGHAETAAGLCSISKLILAFETGIIPKNLHFETPAHDIPSIINGKLKVVTENTPLPGNLVAANAFGFGGANSHAVLKRNLKEKAAFPPRTIPVLVNVSGRTKEAVEHYLDQIEKYQDDDELLALINQIHKKAIANHPYRGYLLLGEQNIREVSRVPSSDRPLWFVFPGMGCQWPKMGKALMQLEAFRSTIQRCHTTLKQFGIDLIDVICNGTEETLKNAYNCFPSISAMEFAFIDVLKSYGIVPDGYVGHSLGEIACAYMEGHLTPEEAILIAFSRPYGCDKGQVKPGKMAAVAMTKEECAKRLPPNVTIACFNAKNSVTISGDGNGVEKMVAELQAEGIFARVVNSANYAFHSKYIADSLPYVAEILNKVLTKPVMRSKKWISTAFPESEWETDKAKFNSTEYHLHNFRNPALFDQVYENIPDNAVVVEVAPHGLLNAILKREFPSTVSLHMTGNRSSEDNLKFFLSSLGKIFNSGINMDLSCQHPHVSFPVSRGTPMIAPMIKWDHSVEFYVPYYIHNDCIGKSLQVDITDDEYSNIVGHTIDGRVLMPATGYLQLIWKTFADFSATEFHKFPIVFENVKFLRMTVLKPESPANFLINILKSSGYFEIFESGSVVCSGYVRLLKNYQQELVKATKQTPESKDKMLLNDIYKELHLRRYNYHGYYKGIKECDLNVTKGKLFFRNDWIGFLDTMLQFVAFSIPTRDLNLPTFVRKVVINPEEHLKSVDSKTEDVPITYNHNLKLVTCGGVQMTNLECSKAPKRPMQNSNLILERSKVVPYRSISEQFSQEETISSALGVVLENLSGTVAIGELSKNVDFIKLTEKSLQNEPLLQYTKNDFKEPTEATYDLILLSDDSIHVFASDLYANSLKPGGFILYVGPENHLKQFTLTQVFNHKIGTSSVILMRKIVEYEGPTTTILVDNLNLSWMDKIHEAKSKGFKKIYIVGHGEENSGVLGLVRSLRREPEGTVFRAVLIHDKAVDAFSLNLDLHKSQLDYDLAYNILKDKKWGHLRHLPFNEIKEKTVSSAAVYVQTPGDLSSLKWVETPFYDFEKETNEHIAVYYVGLNFKDAMLATGRLHLKNDKPSIKSDKDVLGIEYSGIDAKGNRVMGLLCNLSLSLYVKTPLNKLVWKIPDEWTLEDASTVPIVYTTAYFALFSHGRLKRGESILIHSAAGGVGFAAIRVALSMDCEVFCTVGSQEKKNLLLSHFPQLKACNIGSSRDSTFETLIMEATNGDGVDIVLNCVAGDLFLASQRCLKQCGRFLEIGKIDIMAGSPIHTTMFLKNISFHGVCIHNMLNFPQEKLEEVSQLLKEGLEKGVIQPIPRTVFDRTQLERAFRFLTNEKHTGKVVVKVRNDPKTHGEDVILAVPKLFFNPQKVYIIVGGLGGLGLELTQWLIERNATKIILNSRRSELNGYQAYCINKWKNMGVNVVVDTTDTSQYKAAESLLVSAQKQGSIGGIFLLGLILKDNVFDKQTKQTFQEVFKPKYFAGHNLDTASRKVCSSLDHFVVFSSLTSGRGNSGQTNYAMTNSALERLCEKRRADGLHALAIQWGPVADVGYIVNQGTLTRDGKLFGLDSQPISSCLDTLEKFMLKDDTIVASTLLDDQETQTASSGRSPCEIVGNILGIKDTSLMDDNLSLLQLGMDSIMSAEIKQVLFRNYGIDMDVSEVGNLTFGKIKELTSTKVKAEEKTKTTAPTEAASSPLLPNEAIVTLKNGVKKTIFFIHPIEGNVNILKPLAGKLNFTVYGLQSTKDTSSHSIIKTAMEMIQQIKTVQKTGPYVLCGYSFGSLLAVEIALQLEKCKEEVKVVCIDGSPYYISHYLTKGFNNTSNKHMESLMNFSELFDHIDINEIKKLIQSKETNTVEEQINAVSSFISKNTGYAPSLVNSTAINFYKRCVAGAQYRPNGKINGSVVLLRSDVNLNGMTEDYGLREICSQVVPVIKFQGNHKEIVTGSCLQEIADFINSYNF